MSFMAIRVSTQTQSNSTNDSWFTSNRNPDHGKLPWVSQKGPFELALDHHNPDMDLQLQLSTTQNIVYFWTVHRGMSSWWMACGNTSRNPYFCKWFSNQQSNTYKFRVGRTCPFSTNMKRHSHSADPWRFVAGWMCLAEELGSRFTYWLVLVHLKFNYYKKRNISPHL